LGRRRVAIGGKRLLSDVLPGAPLSADPNPPLVARGALLLDALPEAVVTTDGSDRVTGWNRAAERLFGRSRAAMIGAPAVELFARHLRAGTETEIRAAIARGDTWTGGAVTRGSTGPVRELRFTAAPLGGPDAHEGYVFVAHDITAEVRADRTVAAAEARFAEFMAAAPAIAVIKDKQGRYLFANEHVVRTLGDQTGPPWIGRTDYDLWPPAVAAQIRENDGVTLAGTAPREFVQTVPLADGPHTLLVYKFPLQAATGERLLGEIGLDVTDRVRAATAERRSRRREAHALQLAHDRAIVADGLVRLRTGGTVEAIATSIARLVLGLPGIDFAEVLAFEADRQAVPVGLAGSSGSVSTRQPVPFRRSRALRRRALGGAWVERWRPSAQHPLDGWARDLGIEFLGYAPIRSGPHLVGILAVGAAGPSGEAVVAERLPAIVEFAGLAGALLGSSIAARRSLLRARDAIRTVVDRGTFDPVFQPIVELANRRIIGYEALTRFRDGVPPQARFASAAAVGLGPALELATLTAALREAERLPPDLWLSLNVSPDLVLAGEGLRDLVRTAGRPIVCEVTEHAVIDDYVAFRLAMAQLEGLRLAVDDAGAGFASFRHVLELKPAFVKLDRSLVADIDGDPVRQALMVGMSHFAKSVGCRLIAEGIETKAELVTLMELGVPLGQGYLLGRPASAPAPAPAT
jgi:PAS domain S-box-containing protein